jgi:hypothetical protein
VIQRPKLTSLAERVFCTKKVLQDETLQKNAVFVGAKW